jgi:hypothetical protein
MTDVIFSNFYLFYALSCKSLKTVGQIGPGAIGWRVNINGDNATHSSINQMLWWNTLKKIDYSVCTHFLLYKASCYCYWDSVYVAETLLKSPGHHGIFCPFLRSAGRRNKKSFPVVNQTQTVQSDRDMQLCTLVYSTYAHWTVLCIDV